MDTEVGTLVARLRADTSGFTKGLGDAEGAARGFGSSVGRIGEIAAGVFGGSLIDNALRGAVTLFKGAFDEATEAIKVGEETKRVIESMGGAANVSAGHVAKLAEALSNKTGVDDEAIQSGNNLLLTFGNIHNEVGSGNKIMDRATKAALDMSKAMGTDMRTAALGIGKALNDPIAGLTSLGRAGVQFTDAQKDMIKAMVESGDTMGAQKIILGELEKQFGGAAEAAATPFEKLQTRLKNVQEEIGMAMMPALIKLSEWFLSDGMPAIERFIDSVKRNWPEIKQAFQDTWNAIEPILSNMWERLKNSAQIVGDVVKIVKGIFEGDWKAVWEGAKDLVGNLIDGIVQTFIDLPGKVLNAIPGVRDVIHAIGDAVQWVWDKCAEAWPVIQTIIEGAWKVLEPILSTGAGVVRAVADAVQWVWDRCVEAWPIVQGVIEAAWKIIQPYLEAGVSIIRAVADAVQWVWDKSVEAWPIIQGAVETAWNAMKPWLEGLRDVIGGVIDAVGWIKDNAAAAWDGFKEGVSTLWSVVDGPLNFLLSRLQEIVATARAIKRALDDLPGVATGGGIGDVAGIVGARPTNSQMPGNAALPWGGGHAMGGPVMAGTAYLVGEKGPELFMAGRSGSIIPNHQLGGGNSYSINVTVSPGGSPAETGRAIVEAIKSYEDRSGATWRAA